MEIPGISSNFTSPIAPTRQPIAPTTQADKISKSFGDVLNSLNESQANADNLVSQLAGGGNVDLHNLMIASEENDVNMKITIAIRDRLVDAYREVMRMSI
jgi:flagellar hook-basal body complex protein FliE